MVNSLQLFCEISGLSEIDFSRVSGYRSATSLNTHKNESKFNYIDVIRFAQEAVKRLVQKRKIITQEELLKPQEDAAKKGEVKESDQLKREGVASQLQGEGSNRNESPKVDETGTKASGSNSVLESKEEITTREKNRKIIRNKNLHLATRGQRMGIETCGNYDYKVRICPTVMVYLTFVPLIRHFT